MLSQVNASQNSRQMINNTHNGFHVLFDVSPSDPGVFQPSPFTVLPSSQISEPTFIASPRPDQILV